MGKARPLLLGHHSSDRTTLMSHLTIGTEGYEPLIQKHIVVVAASFERWLTTIDGKESNQQISL
jgi:hypothetical protein